MAIVTSTNWEYDTARHLYKLTMVGAEELTGYDDLSTIWTDRDLLRQATQLDRWLKKSAYNVNRIRYRHKDIIEYNIFINDNGEQQAVIDMLVEMAVWDREVQGTLKAYDDQYVDGAGSKMPPSIRDIGVDSGLKFTGEIIGLVPEDEYRVGY